MIKDIQDYKKEIEHLKNQDEYYKDTKTETMGFIGYILGEFFFKGSSISRTTTKKFLNIAIQPNIESGDKKGGKIALIYQSNGKKKALAKRLRKIKFLRNNISLEFGRKPTNDRKKMPKNC